MNTEYIYNRFLTILLLVAIYDKVLVAQTLTRKHAAHDISQIEC